MSYDAIVTEEHQPGLRHHDVRQDDGGQWQERDDGLAWKFVAGNDVRQRRAQQQAS
jgi:hypothetical protein